MVQTTPLTKTIGERLASFLPQGLPEARSILRVYRRADWTSVLSAGRAAHYRILETSLTLEQSD
eukprot:6579996-Pyramimonas_sp.AAC.1